MDYAIVCGTALLAAGLTLFSGFGLGTLLLPAFALLFPVPVAVAATALVHLANNLFKLALVGRHADWGVVARFGVPAALAALAGAALLGALGTLPPLGTYRIGAGAREITAAKAVIGPLIVLFSLFELLPGLGRLSFDRRYLALGGALSGFFGGLSGHQGALRAAFLIKAGLDKERFVGTGVVSAVVVDLVRLPVYGASLWGGDVALLRSGVGGLVAAATAAAFLGSFVGSRALRAVTFRALRLIVGAMLACVGMGMALGLI